MPCPFGRRPSQAAGAACGAPRADPFRPAWCAQTFDLKRSEPLPPLLLPYLRLAFSRTPEQMAAVKMETGVPPVDADVERVRGGGGSSAGRLLLCPHIAALHPLASPTDPAIGRRPGQAEPFIAASRVCAAVSPGEAPDAHPLTHARTHTHIHSHTHSSRSKPRARCRRTWRSAWPRTATRCGRTLRYWRTPPVRPGKRCV